MIRNQLGPYVNRIGAYFMMLEGENYQPKNAPLPDFKYRFQAICS